MTQAQMQMVAELEVEMMSDMYRRMTSACQDKCVSKTFKEAELTKGEAVCLDRCVAKYLDVHDKLGKRLTNMSQGDEAALQKIAAETPPAAKS
ncbi:tin-10 [Pristionchus pacificus]|uniref:Mitochondrial import inner membrane translocase subunit n=1 Tax=Pristionchus pacificus TaxID=54126 RepID=A0A2A6BIJ4_PRIPA|nr:tin-10 [Pristionchus pacificus]|eukprot:PDM65673.1 tin-10 [Pristionchus pacificus]